MKGGIVYSNFVTTVSPQHAWEAVYTEQGRGLGHTLHVHQGKFGGVLNGVDYDVWNPEIDPLIPVQLQRRRRRGQVRGEGGAARPAVVAA